MGGGRKSFRVPSDVSKSVSRSLPSPSVLSAAPTSDHRGPLVRTSTDNRFLKTSFFSPTCDGYILNSFCRRNEIKTEITNSDDQTAGHCRRCLSAKTVEIVYGIGFSQNFIFNAVYRAKVSGRLQRTDRAEFIFRTSVRTEVDDGTSVNHL